MIGKAAVVGKSEQHLVEVDSRHKLQPDTLQAFVELQSACQRNGIDCQLISSYRSFERQLAIWNRKWQGLATLYDAQGEKLDTATLSNEEKVHAILTWSALPGGSRHHWGTDIDVFDKQAAEDAKVDVNLVDSEYTEGGPCFALSEWIKNNAETYGFTRPFMHYNGGVSVERWHLSYQPAAQNFEQLRDLEYLREALVKADMLGKEIVLSMIDDLYPRYVLNQGVDNE